jgi:hypothetical protein
MALSLRRTEVLRSYFTCFDDTMELNENLSRSITTFPGGPVDAAVEKAAKRLGITPTQQAMLLD